ncbi:LemA family protein [Actinopolymorpha sp. B17G11]|uniref:LemA family protein n=1 Tax=unclassified Actinopolymorpha TaxID=2627063 RepID=UPI0032D8EDB4
MIWIIVAVAVVGLLVISGIVSYNRFISQRNLVQESWRQVDVELHRRYDLVPNLVETVKAYAAHERAIFEEVARLRNAAVAGDAGLVDRAQQESALSGALRQLFAVVENYPVLKADQNFLGLQQQLAETEDRIAAGRRFYNANVRGYNTRVEAFPSNLVAAQFRFAKAEYFEVEEAQVRAAPAIDFGGSTASGGAAGSGQTAVPGAPGTTPPQMGPGPGSGATPGSQPT